MLMTIGTVFVFSASSSLKMQFDINTFLNSVQFKNTLYLPIAIVVLYIFSSFDYSKLSFDDKKIYKMPLFWMLVGITILLGLVLIPGIGTEVNYARRWLRINAGPVVINFQPSELAKWLSIIFLAAFLDKYRGQMNIKRFISACAVIGVLFVLIVTQDFGTAAFIGLLAFLMMTIGGAVWWHLLSPLPFAAAAVYAAVMSSPTRINRIKAFLNPESFSGTTGYQAEQSLIALGTGGVSGKGLGFGVSNYGHLPEDTTDFIFAIIGHELGFVGTTLVILLYISFVILGICVVLKCRDNFGRLLAAGIVLAISIQAAINIGVVTVVLPTKGIPLPFVSAGGTSMLVSAAAVGILVNIARQSFEDTSFEEFSYGR
jgi:cell division protein FtsW